jgi:hypothetical protein
VRRQGEALHPDREPLEVLDRIRRTIGEYNFAGQYQQSPAQLGGWSRRNGSNAIARTTGRCPRCTRINWYPSYSDTRFLGTNLEYSIA